MVACRVGNSVTSLMVSAQHHVPPALLPGRKLGTHPLGGQMDPRNCVDGFGGEEKYLVSAGNRTSDHRSRSLVTTPTEISRFPYLHQSV